MKVTIELPDKLAMVLQMEAGMFGTTLAKQCVEDLKDMVESKVNSDFYKETYELALEGRDIRKA